MIERDPIYNTLYRLAFSGLLPWFHQVPQTANHFWGDRDNFSVENDSLLKGTTVMYSIWPSWQDPLRAKSKPQRHKRNTTYCPIYYLLARHWCWHHQLHKKCSTHIHHKSYTSLKQSWTEISPMAPGKRLPLIFQPSITMNYLLICNTFSKYILFGPSPSQVCWSNIAQIPTNHFTIQTTQMPIHQQWPLIHIKSLHHIPHIWAHHITTPILTIK